MTESLAEGGVGGVHVVLAPPTPCAGVQVVPPPPDIPPVERAPPLPVIPPVPDAPAVPELMPPPTPPLPALPPLLLPPLLLPPLLLPPLLLPAAATAACDASHAAGPCIGPAADAAGGGRPARPGLTGLARPASRAAKCHESRADDVVLW